MMVRLLMAETMAVALGRTQGSCLPWTCTYTGLP
jgi:hypothetical protein